MAGRLSTGDVIDIGAGGNSGFGPVQLEHLCGGSIPVWREHLCNGSIPVWWEHPWAMEHPHVPIRSVLWGGLTHCPWKLSLQLGSLAS